MNQVLKDRIILICNSKIKEKGENVGLSFYVFFKNENDEPKLLMEAAIWWIKENKLNHFEKVNKIKNIIEKL